MIFLMGMPGAGKTYWAKQLAMEYNLPCIDMDAYIEHKHQLKISDIFEKYGEDIFRQLEQDALMAIIQTATPDTIIACGGGTPVFYNNLQLMQQTGCIVYLKAELKTLRDRLTTNTGRPLLDNMDIEASLNDILTNRLSIYEQADHILDVENLTTANFEKILSSCTNRL